MTDALVWEFDGRSARLYIHFDVRDHFLKLDTFIRTAESARKVIDALDETFFNGSLEYELIVLHRQKARSSQSSPYGFRAEQPRSSVS